MSEFDNISLTRDLEEETPKAPETALAEKPAEAEIPQVVLSERDKQMICQPHLQRFNTGPFYLSSEAPCDSGCG